MDDAAVGPFVGTFDQSQSNRILKHILPFFLIITRFAQPVVERIPLPFPVLIKMRAAKLPLPERKPSFNSEPQFSRGAKEMKMIRHQQVIADEPRIRFAPDFFKRSLHGFLSQPGHAIFCAHGQEKNSWFVERDFHTLGGRFASGRLFEHRARVK